VSRGRCLVAVIAALALACLALSWLVREATGEARIGLLGLAAALLTLTGLRLRRLAAPVVLHVQVRARRGRAGFEFHPELFEIRGAVLERLADHGFVWLSDFGAVDLQHDVYGLEVTAIRTEELAAGIERVVIRMFPRWRHQRTFYEDHNVGELGWKVMISRHPEDFDDAWQSAG
jgi:hypothetical protein